MIDPKKAAEILYKHFAQLTTEQFIENLKRSCPEVFEDESEEEITVSFPSENTDPQKEKQYLTIS